MGLLGTLKYFAVWYHTLGFSLLDLELNNPMSRLNDAITFGQASLGGIINYFVYPLALVGIKLESVAMGNGIYQNYFIPIGFSEVRGTIYANGYYTVFYSLFQDFRWPGVIGGCFFYGRLLNKSYSRYIWHGRFSSLYLLNTLMFLGLFGIFQSPLESPGFWVAVWGAFFIAKIESSHAGAGSHGY